MRKDMGKLVHETARRKRRAKAVCPNRRLQGRDPDELPSRAPMRERGLEVGFHTTFRPSPLNRMLDSMVGRPWTKVFSEMCRTFDRRNPLERDHRRWLTGQVACNTELVGNEVVVRTATSGLQPLTAICEDYYVHPKSGLLLRSHPGAAHEHRERIRAHKEQRLRDEQARMRPLDERRQLHCIDGLWYEIALASTEGLEDEPRICRDVLIGTMYVTHAKHCSTSRFGIPDRYAKSKRQLSGKELKAYGLANTAKPAA